MRHPSTGRWHITFDRLTMDEGWSSSLYAAARRIERNLRHG
jgi:hypothetical protein